MNTLQYDAATLGEHDFDGGVAALNRRLGDGRFPVVSANLRVVGREDTLALHSYVVLQRAGIRVGVTGFTTPGASVWNHDQLQGRLRLTRLTDALPPVIPEMRRDADLVILLAHAGLDEPASYDTTGIGPENGMAAAAAGAARPDLVILGHTGRILGDTVINGVHFVQAGHDAEQLAIIDVDLIQRDGHYVPVRIRGHTLSLAKVAVPPAVQRRLAEQHRTLQAWTNDVLGTTTASMRAASSRVEDTPVAQWMTDLLRRRAGADVAAITIFDPRAGLELGEVPRSQILALYPSDYTLRAVRVSGAMLQSYLERSARHFFVDSTGRVATNRYLPGSAYDVVGGVDYVIDLSKPAGERIRDLRFKGRPVAATDTLTLALSSGRLNGIGGYDMLRDAPVIYDQGERIVDLLMDDLHSRKMLRPEDFSRPHWHIEPAALAAQARAIYVKPGGPVAAARPSAPPPLFAPDPRKGREDSLRRAALLADSAANRPVASFTNPVARGPGGGSLGALVADAFRTSLRTDIGLVGTNELTSDLPAGQLTTGGFDAAFAARAADGAGRPARIAARTGGRGW
jgi:2',3'-cyclic-nucleotide 2'-phosphodiesterase/3'-nucleotidase